MKPSPWQALTGTFGILAFLGFLAWVFFAGDLTLRPGRNIYVDYNQLGIIETGAPVKIGDKKVGFIKGIGYIRGTKRARPKVRLHLWVDKRYSSWLFKNSRFYFESISIIGQRHINIALPPEGAPLGPHLREGEVVQGVDPSKVDRVLKKTFDTVNLAIATNKELKPYWAKAKAAYDRLKKWEPYIERELRPELERLKAQAKKIQMPPGLTYIKNHAKADFLLFKITYLDGLISGFEKKLDAFEKNLKANTSHWDVAAIQKKVQNIKARTEKVRRLILAIKPMALAIHSVLNSTRGTVGALARDKSIWDDLKMMARRLKNAPLDLLLKRREKKKN